MIKQLILFWFKIQATKAARQVLIHHYNVKEVQQILLGYWQKYLSLKKQVQVMPTMGGSIMVHLAAMSTAFYEELAIRDKSKEEIAKLFYDIAWKIYIKMGKLSWLFASLGSKSNNQKLLKATQLFRAFPFNSPSYVWQDVNTDSDVVGFDCVKCPVAEYFKRNGLSKFCAETWCALDYPLAELWHAKLSRSGSIAEGADRCDFRWTSNRSNHKYKDLNLKESFGATKVVELD